MYISEFLFLNNIVYCIILPSVLLIYNSSWGNTLDEFTNIVNTNSQNFQSRHLLVHLHNPKHLPLLNQQHRLFLLQQTKIKTILFCVPKTPSRMMQPSQTMTTYSFVRHQKPQNFNISTISTPNNHSQRIASTPSSILNSNTPTILPPVGK